MSLHDFEYLLNWREIGAALPMKCLNPDLASYIASSAGTIELARLKLVSVWDSCSFVVEDGRTSSIARNKLAKACFVKEYDKRIEGRITGKMTG